MGCTPSKNSSNIRLHSQLQLNITQNSNEDKTENHSKQVVANQNQEIKGSTTNQKQDNKDKMEESTAEKSDQVTNVLPTSKISLDSDNKKTEDKKPVELTEEEIEEKKQKNLEGAKISWKIFSDGTQLKEEDGKYSKKLRGIIFKTFYGHFAMKGTPLPIQSQYKREYYSLLVESGGVQILCDLVVDIVTRGFKNEDGEVDPDLYKPLANALGILTNFSDNEINRTDLIRNHPTYMEFVVSTLKQMKDVHFSVDKKSSPEDEKIIKSFLSQTHNLAMRDENIAKLRHLGYVSALIPYMNSGIETYRLSSLAALADIVDEKESEILSTDQEVLKFLINSLKKSINDPQRRMFGWATAELARTVRRIARNDANKRLLVELGVLQPLVDLAKYDDENEQKEAVGALWSLSFDEENQKAMINDKESFPVDTFIKLKNSPYKEVRKICNGALWTMREKLSESEKYRTTGNQYMKTGSTASLQRKSASAGHIMISYQWANQALIKSVRDGLRASGLRVWMDIDDMEGSTIDAMASAVEEADIVLVCYSQKYKDSDNCRAEAEYAFQKKKKIIPLKMERDYKPDGWLGFIIGAKLFFDFSGKYTFESRLDGLLKELHVKLGKDEVDGMIVAEKAAFVSSEKPYVAPVPTAVESGSHITGVPRNTPPVQISETLKNWTLQQVAAWLTKHQIPKERFNNLTGIEVAFLQVVMTESPDFFYKIITETMQIKDLLTMSRLRFALNDTTL